MQAAGGRGADPGAGAGDQSDLAIELHRLGHTRILPHPIIRAMTIAISPTLWVEWTRIPIQALS